MIYVGIDPGASGGVAVLTDRGYVLKTEPLGGKTDRDLWDLISGLRHTAARYFAVLERVGGYTQAGGPQPGSAMFNFGAGYGKLKMALTAACVPYLEVMPQKWQKAVGVPTRGKAESKVAFKARLKGLAQSLFPNEKVTLAVSDALLIAYYCREIKGQGGRK